MNVLGRLILNSRKDRRKTVKTERLTFLIIESFNSLIVVVVAIVNNQKSRLILVYMEVHYFISWLFK